MTDHQEAALRRYVESWQKARGELPRMPWDPDVDPIVYVGEKDAESWIQWHPVVKPPGRTLAELAPDLAPFHPSVEAYFAKWWFLALEGRVGDKMLSMQPNTPGYDPEEYLDLVRQYAASRQRPLTHVPIGLDNRSSLQLVVDNRTGAVSIEDWETGTFEPVAASLDDLFQRIEV
jgi:hypothetical protein